MGKIDIINLKFDNEIYKTSAIRKAIADYEALAEFSIKEKKNYTLVGIKKACFSRSNSFIGEFGNYVLGLTKKCC